MAILRPYQTEAVESIFRYWDKQMGRNCLIVAPTGSGKSIILAETVRQLCTGWPDIKILIITDTKELILQDKKAILNHYPNCSIGVYSAGIGEKSTNARVILCSIQSMYNKAYDFGHVDVVFIDEAHLVSPKSTTRFQTLFAQLKLSSPNFVVVGLTATPFRLSEGMLHEGEGALFDGIAYVCDMRQLIADGYLTKVISKGGLAKINLEGVHIKNGEWDPRELAHAADSEELVRLAVKEIVELGADRKAWLIFTSSIAHSEHVKAELEKYKIDCAIVTGDTPSEERDGIIDRYRKGNLRCLINVGIYNKGLDVAQIDLVVLLTSTKSRGRYIQMVGRSMRISPGKTESLLLDFGRSCMDHGPIDTIDVVKTKDIFRCEKKPVPQKGCPKCHCIFHARILVCPGCGYQYPTPEATARHGTEAFDGAVLSDQQKPFIVDVKDTWISRHKKSGKPDSVKVAFYDSMEREYPMWLALNSDSPYAVEKSRAIVKQFGGSASDVEGALKEYFNWKQVDKIQVRMEGRFPRILGFVFKKDQSTQQKIDDGGE